MNKKFNNEIEKGVWKMPQKLFDEIQEDNYPISVLYKDGTIADAIWHYSMNWVETESFGEFALWSERRESRNWFKDLLDKIRG